MSSGWKDSENQGEEDGEARHVDGRSDGELFAVLALGGSEGVFEDGLAALLDELVDGEVLALGLDEFGEPLDAPAHVHGFVDDVVEDGLGGAGVVLLWTYFL